MASAIDEWSETATVAMRSNKTSASASLTLSSASASANVERRHLSATLTDALHEGWKKLGLAAKAPRLFLLNCRLVLKFGPDIFVATSRGDN